MTEQYTVEHTFELSNGGKVPQETVVYGELKPNNAARANRDWVMDHWEEKDSFPVFVDETTGEGFAVVPAEFVGESEESVLIIREFDLATVDADGGEVDVW